MTEKRTEKSNERLLWASVCGQWWGLLHNKYKKKLLDEPEVFVWLRVYLCVVCECDWEIVCLDNWKDIASIEQEINKFCSVPAHLRHSFCRRRRCRARFSFGPFTSAQKLVFVLLFLVAPNVNDFCNTFIGFVLLRSPRVSVCSAGHFSFVFVPFTCLPCTSLFVVSSIWWWQTIYSSGQFW